jgi:E3 ubiquitin-protein ligase synoviolin
LTVFRNEIDTPILLMFASLIYVKSFHWLGKSRMEYNEQIQPLPMKAHIRMFSLLFCLIIIDIGVSAYCIKRTINQGKSVFILFGFEFGLLVINIFILFFRYVIQSMDSYLETGLSSKGFALMLIDLIGDASKFVTYSFFFCLIFVYYGLPIHIIR